MTEKNLFIPLKREYYEAFKSGEKTVEYRLYGPRWNEKTCRVGRKTTLSLGYSKKHRLNAVVSGFWKSSLIPRNPDFIACYGNIKNAVAACIHLKVTR